MDREYAITKDTFRDEATGRDCSKGPAKGSYSVEGRRAGRFICFATGAKGMIVWTHDRFNILGYASLENTPSGPDWKGLHRWWRNAGRLVGEDER